MRRMLCSDTLQIEEEERDRRIASGFVAPREMDVRLSQMQSDLLRVVARAVARAGADKERAERVLAEKARLAGHEMERESNAAMALQVMEQERARRVNGPKPQEPHGLRLLHLALHELFRYRSLRADVAGEVMSRLQSDALQLRVLPELLRLLNGRLAAAGMDAEAQYFVAQHRFASVLDQLRWRVGRRYTSIAAREAQIELLEAGISLPHYIEEAKLACNVFINRRGAVADVKALAAEEQFVRIVRQRVFAVCEQVRRHVARREVARAAEVERAQRLAAERYFEVLEDLHRHFNRKAVNAQVLAEPVRAAHPHGMSLLMQKQIHDRHAARVVAAACAERQTELVQRWRMFDVIQEIDHVFGGKAATAMSEAGQAERMHALLFAPVLEALRSRAARKLAREAALAEQVRVKAMGSLFSAKYQLRQCLAQLLGKSARVQAAADAQSLLVAHGCQFAMRNTVLPLLVRRVNRPAVAKLAAEAQGQRVAADKLQRFVLPQLESRFARLAVRAAVAAQQQLPAPVAPPAVRLGKELINEAIRRRSHAQASREELQVNINKHIFERVVADLEHQAHRRVAAELTALERAARVHADKMRLVRGELHAGLESMLASLLASAGRSEALERYSAVPEAHRTHVAHVHLELISAK